MLGPSEVFCLTLTILPDVNAFNYQDNSLYLLYEKPPYTVKMISNTFEIGKPF